ncbi:hypothetical protein NA57DRAFT_78828 [Rhizodiscina lignyota]|uniref:Uncharacterized protein n=1 Tax=Rhizodiscina lignyota TaxID=1504668 RepID=A0A9P4M3T5_9PEZI|nr:hypothetical protein NA57DRAFT_78828 [Rhizodiscina lignyota]
MASSIDQFKKTEAQSIRHITITLPVSFTAFTDAFEAKLGRISMSLFRNSKSFHDYETATAEVNGGEPFAISNNYNHGYLATIRNQDIGEGKKRVGKRYDFGNVLFASSMTVHDIRAGQYAPLTMLVWEAKEGETVCQWDSAEDLMGKGTEGNPEVVKVAEMLDRERETVVMEAFETATGKEKL